MSRYTNALCVQWTVIPPKTGIIDVSKSIRVVEGTFIKPTHSKYYRISSPTLLLLAFGRHKNILVF